MLADEEVPLVVLGERGDEALHFLCTATTAVCKTGQGGGVAKGTYV